MGRVRLFFGSMFSEVGSGLSGVLSVPFTIAALWVSSPIQRWLYAAVAIVCVCVSSFRIWRREYDRAERELARHTRPYINPEVLYCFWGGDRLSNGAVSGYVYALITLVNLTDQPTTIREYRLDFEAEGKALSGINDVEFMQGELSYYQNLFIPGTTSLNGMNKTPIQTICLSISRQYPLSKGAHATGWIAARMSTRHLNQFGTFPAKVRLCVTDAFGIEHASDFIDLMAYYAEFA